MATAFIKRTFHIITFWLLIFETINLKAISAQANKDLEKRDKNHIVDILKLNDKETGEKLNRKKELLTKLSKIYEENIKPIEEAYNFPALHSHTISDGDIFAKPTILLFGPWSVGKSSMINYLTDHENSIHGLEIGAAPTTKDFTVIQYGDKEKLIEGSVLTIDSRFSSLTRFGHRFIENFKGINLKSSILKKLTFIDTPGIIENKKQQERGYPFDDVCEWFIKRADLIFMIFDPTKLDIGHELEKLFIKLKGHEAKIRIILNKADMVTSQELMRIYGALFWSLAPFINETEPPRVYVGSFWLNKFKSHQNNDLFLQEEKTLLKDMNEAIENYIENKIAFVRRHAGFVKNHALTVDLYKKAYDDNRGFMSNDESIKMDVIDNPKKHKIFEKLISSGKISVLDLPDHEHYKAFFSSQDLQNFRSLKNNCGYFSNCLYDDLLNAINELLPKLLQSDNYCSVDSCP